MLWLTEVGEARAATWFNDNWTCERENYTIATAGYVGNHLCSGIESNWIYMRRDVVGCAGTTQRISLPVLAHFPASIHSVLDAVSFNLKQETRSQDPLPENWCA